MPTFLRVIEDAAGFEDRGDLAEALQLPLVAGRVVREQLVRQVDRQLVAGADFVDEPLLRFERDQVAAVDRVAEEDAGVELGDDGSDAGRGQGDRGVLAGGAAAEVLAADDDLVRRDELVVGVERDVALRQPRLRRPARWLSAYLPNILYSAGIDGLNVRYWAGMIWSVSTLSPRTKALPVMVCCISDSGRDRARSFIFDTRSRGEFIEGAGVRLDRLHRL